MFTNNCNNTVFCNRPHFQCTKYKRQSCGCTGTELWHWKTDGVITDNCCTVGCDAMWSSTSIEVRIFTCAQSNSWPIELSFLCYGVHILCQHKLTLGHWVLKMLKPFNRPQNSLPFMNSSFITMFTDPFQEPCKSHPNTHTQINLILSSNLYPCLESDFISLVSQLNLNECFSNLPCV